MKGFSFLIFGQKNLLKVMRHTCLVYTVPHSTTEDLVSTHTMPRKIMNLPYSIRMYWTIFWQPADRSYTTTYFWKNSYRSWYLISLSFFWHLLRPKWSFFRGKVSLWKMFENDRIAFFVWKWRQFWIHRWLGDLYNFITLPFAWVTQPYIDEA